jgi:hypothetical protein
MAAKKMTVRDAYAKAKKSESAKNGSKGGTLYKGSKGIQRARAESKSQNPSVRNKVGAKPKDRKGPWDNIGRGLKTGAKIGATLFTENLKTIAKPSRVVTEEVKGIKQDIKDKNIRNLAIQALGAVPLGRGAKGISKALNVADDVIDASRPVAKAAKKATTVKKATKKAAGKTEKATKKAASTTKKAEAPKAPKATPKAAPKVEAPKMSPAVESATKELSAIREAKAAFKGQKVSGGKASAGWAELGRKERRAQEKLNNALRAEQRTGKAAENMKKIGKTEPTRVDLSEGQTITSNKGIKAPAKPRAYSKVGRTPKDRSGNAPLEKNQRYTYEADEMRRIEGKERFERREARRFEKSTKNKERQAKVDTRTKQARVEANWKEVKAKAETGGPKAKARAERFRKFWNEQGFNLK